MQPRFLYFPLFFADTISCTFCELAFVDAVLGRRTERGGSPALQITLLAIDGQIRLRLI